MPIEIRFVSSRNKAEPSELRVCHVTWFPALMTTLSDTMCAVTRHHFCHYWGKVEDWKLRSQRQFSFPVPEKLCKQYAEWAGWAEWTYKEDEDDEGQQLDVDTGGSDGVKGVRPTP
jgi:hypothetical protein